MGRGLPLSVGPFPSAHDAHQAAALAVQAKILRVSKRDRGGLRAGVHVQGRACWKTGGEERAEERRGLRRG